MCAGGPPNPVTPIRVHSRATVPSAGLASGRPGALARVFHYWPAGWNSSIGLPDGS